MLEFIQTDIYARFRKLIGDEVVYVCASDAHGTPIEMNAAKRKISPQELVESFHKQHKEDLDRFEIGLDGFYSTDSQRNRNHVYNIYHTADHNGHIFRDLVEQFYCEKCGRFLPDRLIRGTCPHCGRDDQYGDACEACGSIYEPTELRNPRCGECGSSPTIRMSQHYFFELKHFEKFISQWANKAHLHREVKLLIDDWLNKGLRDWDISRDAPYFGFEIPGEEDKYFYVWMDAPIGYIAATEQFFADTMTSVESYHKNRNDYWFDPDTDVELHHFIGKDIIYFHTLFWPALLGAAGYRTPTDIHVHGFLTLGSHKMSKTRGRFVTPRDWDLSPNYLRWYFASKLKDSLTDVDLNTDEFISRVNAELVNDITNLVSRSINFLNKKLNSTLGKLSAEHKHLLDAVDCIVRDTREDYTCLNFHKVTRNILAISELANNYMQSSAPWERVKTDPEGARGDLTFIINCVKTLCIIIKPVLPSYSKKIENMLGVGELTWSDIGLKLENCEINQFERLLDRIEK
jgi:methionyl-tRNA synthetase